MILYMFFRLMSYSVKLFAGLIDRQIDRSIDRLVGRSIGRSIDRSMDRLNERTNERRGTLRRSIIALGYHRLDLTSVRFGWSLEVTTIIRNLDLLQIFRIIRR